MPSANNLKGPQFLTKSYVENILKKYFKDLTLKVKNIETMPAVGKGEGYCSVMTRMTVYYEIDQENVVKKINFIVKSTFENDPRLFNVLQQYDVFNTEMEMYQIVFPKLQQILYEINDMEQLCAKTIYVDYERNTIILEDLSAREFITANRLVGMDEAHIKVCLTKLAKMHAAAAVLNEREMGCLEKYSHGIFNRHVNCYGVFFENMFGVCAKFAETCPELGIYYRDKLLNLIPLVAEYGTRCYDSKPKHFLTLNHGDMWTNNCMVQYYDQKGQTNVKDILLLDFQYSCWTSPAIDLHYFLSTSLQDDLLFNHQNKFIQHYHRVLAETLEKLKYKQHIPTLHEFYLQLLERGFFAVAISLTSLPLLINDKTEDADFECLVGNDERARRFHNILYTNERLQRILKVMLPRFDQMGLLDVVEL